MAYFNKILVFAFVWIIVTSSHTIYGGQCLGTCFYDERANHQKLIERQNTLLTIIHQERLSNDSCKKLSGIMTKLTQTDDILFQDMIEYCKDLSPKNADDCDKLYTILHSTAQANNLVLLKKLLQITCAKKEMILPVEVHKQIAKEFKKNNNNEEATFWFDCFKKYCEKKYFDFRVEYADYCDIICLFDHEDKLKVRQYFKNYSTNPCIEPSIFYSARKIQILLLQERDPELLQQIQNDDSKESEQMEKIEQALKEYSDSPQKITVTEK